MTDELRINSEYILIPNGSFVESHVCLAFYNISTRKFIPKKTLHYSYIYNFNAIRLYVCLALDFEEISMASWPRPRSTDVSFKTDFLSGKLYRPLDSVFQLNQNPSSGDIGKLQELLSTACKTEF